MPAAYDVLFTVTIGVLGLVIGSFLNVVILRVPKDESIAFPGSHCPKCGHALEWFENIPVLSWLALRAKCRSCKAPISPRYAIIELLTGCLFLAAWARFGLSGELAWGLAFIGFLVPIVFIDAEHWIIPLEIALIGIATAIGLKLIVAVGGAYVHDRPVDFEPVVTALIGAAAAFVTFRIIEFLGWLVTKQEAMGSGDKFLFAMMGAFLGWKPLLGALMLASVQGAIWGLARIGLTGRAAAEKEPQGGATAAAPGDAESGRKESTPGDEGAAAPVGGPPVEGATGSGASSDAGAPAAATTAAASPAGDAGAPSIASTTAPSPSGDGNAAPATSATAPVPSGDASASTTEGTTAPSPSDDGNAAPATSATAPVPSGDASGSASTPDAASPTGTIASAPPAPGASASATTDEDDPARLPWTPDVFKPGIPLWKRVVVELPWSVFLQPIPDDPPLPEGAPEDAEPEWTPGVTNLPFGPWLGLAGLEILLVGPALSAHLGPGLLSQMLRLVFST